jgi:hypothetical protein
MIYLSFMVEFWLVYVGFNLPILLLFMSLHLINQLQKNILEEG